MNPLANFLASGTSTLAVPLAVFDAWNARNAVKVGGPIYWLTDPAQRAAEWAAQQEHYRRTLVKLQPCLRGKDCLLSWIEDIDVYE